MWICVCSKDAQKQLAWASLINKRWTTRTLDKGAFLWEDPDQDSDLWHSFWANPFSDQWCIGSTLVMDSSDHWSEWSANGLLDQWSSTFLPSVNSICFVVSGLNSNLFLWKSSEIWQSASEIQIFEWALQTFVSVLPGNCCITPPNTRAWNPLICNIAWDIITGYFCSFVLATSCYFAVCLGCFNTFAPIVMVKFWSYEPKFSSFGMPWFEWSWIINPDLDPPKGT